MKMISRSLAALAIAFASAASGSSLVNAAPAPVQATPAGAPHALTRDDVEAYLDGFFPEALARSDIAGAVVVVVKDGHVLLEKGYGFSDVETRAPVDPARTLFRPGSISKLFTWTSVMQLVEAGKIDLDRDVNDYIDFPIPATFPEPITMRDLMTHTSGFEEHIKGLMVDDRARLMTLRTALITSLPKRIYPPGEVSAYSNYGAALAGYIVQRVSGEKFEYYVADHIFKPLHMTHSTFVQPLPKALQPDMSKGYFSTGAKPQPFEMISLSPAGALSSSGDDIAQFMMAHLNNGSYGGAQILKPDTAKLMHAPAFQPTPVLPPMALGFYHEDFNGHPIVGHGGDSQVFHSDLHLILDENVGLFVSLNSVGANEGLLTGTRTMLLEGFMNRYFPGPALPVAKPIANAAKDAALVAGTYISSRRSDSTFMRLATLAGPVTFVANPDGSLSAPGAEAAGIRAPKKFIEIAPFVWRDEHSPHRLVARVEDGRVKWISLDLFPAVFVLQPVPFLLSPRFQVPLLLATIAMLVLTVLFWPIKAILRWRYDRPFDLTGREAMLYRAARIAALVDLALFAGWTLFLLNGQSHLDVFDSQNDYVLRIFQVLAVLGVVGAAAPVWQFFAGLGSGARPWWTKITDAGLALAALSTVWFVFAYRLVTVSLNY
jgi:CubicO group peptidase (beta-lactamase class C family)